MVMPSDCCDDTTNPNDRRYLRDRSRQRGARPCDAGRAAHALRLRAVIAGLHANAATAAETDWHAICTVYDSLLGLAD